jgi:UrcA family protein
MSCGGYNFNTSKLLLLTFGAVIAGSAIAAEELGQVTVETTRPTKVLVGRSAIGASIEQITLTRKVSFADLNLSTQQGAAELEKRVTDTAKAACKELDRLYPQEAASKVSCAQEAADNAMVQARAAIDAAGKRAHGTTDAK